MIFTGKDGSIYEIPKERYAEFEVSPQRAKEILDMAKSMNKSSSNNEVAGYMNDTGQAVGLGLYAAYGVVAAISTIRTGNQEYINQFNQTGQNIINNMRRY
ncbi:MULTISPECIES: hypothetical protein [Brachyspira]|uniref:hypothetical protein n=1 Tax=Brachyspira TaxID=29521 RepID=UPI0030055156